VSRCTSALLGVGRGAGVVAVTITASPRLNSAASTVAPRLMSAVMARDEYFFLISAHT
jgi:hypothetical protein